MIFYFGMAMISFTIMSYPIHTFSEMSLGKKESKHMRGVGGYIAVLIFSLIWPVFLTMFLATIIKERR